MKKNDQKTAAKVDEMQAEGRAEIESHLALFTPEKTVRGLYKPGRRIL
jgi:hypothetical protein